MSVTVLMPKKKIEFEWLWGKRCRSRDPLDPIGHYQHVSPKSKKNLKRSDTPCWPLLFRPINVGRRPKITKDKPP